MKKTLSLLAALTALVLSGSTARADRETAKFNTIRADKLLKAKEWDKAEELYRKALQEDEAYMPAIFGLAEALIGAGKQPDGIAELRRLLEYVEKNPPDSAWNDLVAKTRKRLDEIDASGRVLQKITDEYVSALVDMAGKCLKEDPEVAERALRRVMKIRPASREAADLLKKMGKSASGDATAIFNGKNLSGWLVGAPDWSVQDGCIIVDSPNGGAHNRTELFLKGDFDILAEMKLLQMYAGGAPGFNMITGIRKDFDWYALGIFNGRFSWVEQDSGQDVRSICQVFPIDMPKPIDIEQWNTFELRCRNGEAVVFLNGKEMAKETWSEKRRNGYVGFWIQNAKVAIRKFEVVQR